MDCECSTLLFIVLGLHIHGMYVSCRLSVVFHFSLVLGPLLYCCCYDGPGIDVDPFATFYDISIYIYLMAMNEVIFIPMKCMFIYVAFIYCNASRYGLNAPIIYVYVRTWLMFSKKKNTFML